jgi:anti-sigma-K factor RskA
MILITRKCDKSHGLTEHHGMKMSSCKRGIPMKTVFRASTFLAISIAIALTTANAQRLAAQDAPASAGVPVRMVVTLEVRHGSSVPAIYREDVMVYQGRDRLKVVDWVGLQGDQSRLELFLLLDDASSTSLGSQLDDLRAFINSQSPNTAIGVGYMRNGTVDTVQSLTKDHASAAKSLR